MNQAIAEILQAHGLDPTTADASKHSGILNIGDHSNPEGYEKMRGSSLFSVEFKSFRFQW